MLSSVPGRNAGTKKGNPWMWSQWVCPMNRWIRSGWRSVRARWSPSSRAPVPQSSTISVPSAARTSMHDVLPPYRAVLEPGAAMDPRVPQKRTFTAPHHIPNARPGPRSPLEGQAPRPATSPAPTGGARDAPGSAPAIRLECGAAPKPRRRRFAMTLPLIPTAVVGSHGRPGWWFAGVKAIERGEFGPADLEELLDDAADTAIRDMERAGIDVITDGEVRRLDGYVDSYYAIIRGIAPIPVRRKAGPWGYDQQTRYEAVGRIETPPGGLGIVKEFEYLRRHTTRATKATCAGPLTFGSRIQPGTTYKGVVGRPPRSQKHTT